MLCDSCNKPLQQMDDDSLYCPYCSQKYSDNYIFTDDSLYDASRVRVMILNAEHEAKQMYEDSKDCCSKYKSVMEEVKL